MSDAIEAERKRAIAAIHWVFNADGTVGERAMAQEAIHKINDPTFMPALTAYEAAKGGGVGVKPLEWQELSDDRGDGTREPNSDWEAETPFGYYEIGMLPVPESDITVWSLTFGIEEEYIGGDHVSPEAAKAVAQADYEARIRSALTSPASGERDAVIEECAKVAEAEELTGDAPSHFTQHEIDIVTATVRSTARSIAAAIRALRMEGK